MELRTRLVVEVCQTTRLPIAPQHSPGEGEKKRSWNFWAVFFGRKPWSRARSCIFIGPDPRFDRARFGRTDPARIEPATILTGFAPHLKTFSGLIAIYFGGFFAHASCLALALGRVVRCVGSTRHRNPGCLSAQSPKWRWNGRIE